MGEDFITLLLEMKGMTPISLLTMYLLTLFRIVPIAAFSPFFGSNVMPAIAKMGFAVFVSITFLPIAMIYANADLNFNVIFIGLALKELGIGTALAFFSKIPFYVVESAGSIIDYQRGASQMMSQDPTLKVQASSIGIMYNYLLIVIFFMIGGPMHFFDGISLSFEVLPIDGLIKGKFFHLELPFWQQTIGTMAYLFAMAIQMAAPAIVGVLMAETFLGIANRLAPQVQIAFLGMPLKSLLAILVMWVGWFVMLKAFGKQSTDFFAEIYSQIKNITLYN